MYAIQIMKTKATILTTTLLVLLLSSATQALCAVKQFSTAGFYALSDTPRTVQSMNPAWRFTKAPDNTMPHAWKADYDDSKWQTVSLPNGMEYLPVEASGGVNYRGGAWYRKHFALPEQCANKRVVLYFEAIMGKSKVWVNGEQVTEHFGGFLPVAVDVTAQLKAGQPNVIAVWCDNSNDPMYPPGKPQEMLDFCYFGGIYRDCWLIATDKDTYITDPNMIDKVAGGGVFVSFSNVSEQTAMIDIATDIAGVGKVQYQLKDNDGNLVAKSTKNQIEVKMPKLWSPESPYLYQLEVRVLDKRGKVVDGYMQKIGIRSIKFTNKEGCILNGKPYPRKLMGANRHQDFAVVGNALSNNLHWRDAQKLKEAGMEIIRNAHYPQDPAFMDACDELGLFVIVNTPGWQFWNDAPEFEQRVYSDIQNMVRRDRNRASVLMWEPILNETWYPDYFAANVHNLVKKEYPYAGCYTACDLEARGRDNFDIIFTHPAIGEGGGYGAGDHVDTTKVYFTREWGDNVDDWNSHNSLSRVARQWGEIPQLIQAKHYANPNYQYTSYETLSKTAPNHFGGTLWHSFDHQRGYHPDPFYGGVMDAFRRPKTSYYMFQAQAKQLAPMVYIANEMTPFSPEDVTVFTNCHSVRLHTYFGDTLRVKKNDGRWIIFEDSYNFMEDKALARAGKHAKSFILAEGLNEQGEVVATDRRSMSRRPARLELIVDTLGASPVADGGDLVVVVAQMVDANGVVKRLNNNIVRFEIEGEGRLIGSQLCQTNPVPVLWGEAPILVQTTTQPGQITVRGSVLLPGDNTPIGGEVTFMTTAAPIGMMYDPAHLSDNESKPVVVTGVVVDNAKRAEIERQLREVEAQQEAFGEKKK